VAISSATPTSALTCGAPAEPYPTYPDPYDGEAGVRGRSAVQNEEVVAVVVTWNRRELLAEALRAVQAQTAPLRRTIVVDNASTDDTLDMVARDFPEVEAIPVARNLGGAGGFAVGLDSALAEPCDAVWLMDDDTIPEPTALAELLRSRRAAHRGRPPALCASRVSWIDGRDHPMNTPRTKAGARHSERAAAAAAGGIPIRSASFVSVLVDAALVRQRGLPLADYFLWNDDFEFTTRLTKGRLAIYCPASVVVHKTKTFGSTDADPGERFYFEVRNKVWLFTRSRGLNPLEKAAYGSSTLRRWARTVSHSSNRSVLLRGLGRGLWDGIRRGPRPTAEVIAGVVVRDEQQGHRA